MRARVNLKTALVLMTTTLFAVSASADSIWKSWLKLSKAGGNYEGVVTNARTPTELGGWQKVGESMIARDAPLIHEAWRALRPPFGELDKIVLHRVVRKGRDRRPDPEKVILMLPGTWGTGGWSEFADPNVNTMTYLANNGYDVYTIDYRSANVQAMDYDQFTEQGIDLSATTDWTLGVFRDDIHACVTKIRAVSGATKIFMSGFSRGTGHMVVYASKYADSLKGLIFLDGFVKDYPPTGTPMDEATFGQLVQLFKAGLLTDPTSGNPVQWLIGFNYYTPNYPSWRLAGVMPYARATVGGALPAGYGVVSDFVANDAYHLWDSMGQGPGLFTNYAGGYIARDVLVRELNEFNPYYPNIQALEELQLEAYDDVPYFDYDDNPIDLPALSFHSSFSCPGMSCLDQSIPNWTDSPDVTSHFLEGYGHIDVLFGTNSAADVKEPMLQWLDAHGG